MPRLPPLSVAEASERSGVPKRTIQYAITMGWLKAHKFTGATGAFVIEQADLDRWLEKRADEANAG
jgi:excisionase family DNA binding protein